MTPNSLKSLLEKVSRGELSIEAASEQLATLPLTSLDHSTLDTHRELRQGIPEVIFGQGKTAAQIIDNMEALHQSHGRTLVTRVNPHKARRITSTLPDAIYHKTARILTLGSLENQISAEAPSVVIACAGTSDLPVAEEAALTLTFLGHRTIRLNDVGVAGLHRLLPHLETLRNAHVVISVAGMEGALTSVIGGLVACPVVGVPTSVGYGVAKNGTVALNSMLSSCASGVAVVNIDNGFGAAVFAHTILSIK